MDYILLDTGNGKKLEQVGQYRLVRQALNAFWKPSLPDPEWADADGIFERNSSGGGKWTWKKGKEPLPWSIQWGGLKMLIKPTNFGHLGFFAEQHENWEWLKKRISKMPGNVSALNMFAYSGGSSLAMAMAGAEVCHLDAAKGMNEWAKENLELNSQIPPKIRWITDDVTKFLQREIRRERKYNGIVLDPPSFGRGPQGQVWKIEESIIPLLELCSEIIDNKKPFFVLLSSHSQGFTPLALERVLLHVFGKGRVESGEMTVLEQNGNPFPAGTFARFVS